MALAITDPDLLFLALDLVEAARDDGLFIPAFGSLAHQTEIADVMLLVVERADYTSVQYLIKSVNAGASFECGYMLSIGFKTRMMRLNRHGNIQLAYCVGVLLNAKQASFQRPRAACTPFGPLHCSEPRL
jgi:hypothetical protein